MRWTKLAKILAELRRDRDAGRPVNKFDIALLEMHWADMEVWALPDTVERP